MTALKIATIYAHFNLENQIDNACINNLIGLKAISSQIIFVTTSQLPENEIEKLKPYCHHIECRENIGLDFGSYAHGLKLINTQEFDYIILTNDSVYGPIYPLQETLDKAIKSPSDVFGITLSNEKHPHLQSYFLLFKQPVIQSSVFKNFWNTIELNKSKKEIIQDYEIGLSQALINANFKLDALYKCKLNLIQKIFIFVGKTAYGYKWFRLKKIIYKLQHKRDLGFNPTHLLAHKLVKRYKVPYVKKELINKNPYQLKITKELKELY